MPVVEEDTDAIDETENTTTYASFRKPQTRQIWSKQGQERHPGLSQACSAEQAP